MVHYNHDACHHSDTCKRMEIRNSLIAIVGSRYSFRHLRARANTGAIPDLLAQLSRLLHSIAPVSA